MISSFAKEKSLLPQIAIAIATAYVYMRWALVYWVQNVDAVEMNNNGIDSHKTKRHSEPHQNGAMVLWRMTCVAGVVYVQLTY